MNTTAARTTAADAAISNASATKSTGAGADDSSVTTLNNAAHIPVAELARRIRLHCVEMTARANASHVGSALSAADVIAVLFSKVLRLDAARPEWPERDRFILSKGHACTALYAALAEAGYFPASDLETFYRDGSPLAGHATHKGVAGVEVSTGSLGHGLPLACGMALAAKRDRKDFRVFCVLSDGECDEGSTWEAALFAPHHGLDNLTVVIDYNKIQSLGRVEDVLSLKPLGAKWRAFGWGARVVNGHDTASLEEVMTNLPIEPGRPSCIVAHTVKGRGVSFMEDELRWHYRAPRGELLERARAELGGAR